MLRNIFVLFFLILAIGIPPVAAQKNSTQAPPIKTNVKLVRINIVVTTPEGARVKGLEQKNFRVFEDGVEQEIVSLAHESRPLSLCVIADNSGSMDSDKLDKLMVAVRNAAKLGNSANDFCLITFRHYKEEKKYKDKPINLTGPEFVKADEMLEAAGAISEGEGKTPLLDAIGDKGFAIDMIAKRWQQERRERAELVKQIAELTKQNSPHAKDALEELGSKIEKTKRQYAILVISDGGDNASLVSKNQVMSKLEESEAKLYAIGTFELDLERNKNRPDEEMRGPELLRDLAEKKGGRMISALRMQFVPGIVTQVLEELTMEDALYYYNNKQSAKPSENKDDGKGKKQSKKKHGNCKDWANVKVKIIPNRGQPQLFSPFVKQGYCRDEEPRQ